MHLRVLPVALLLSTTALLSMEVAETRGSYSNHPSATINDLSNPTDLRAQDYRNFFEKESNATIFNKIAKFQAHLSGDLEKDQHIKEWKHILHAASQYLHSNGNEVESKMIWHFYNLNNQLINRKVTGNTQEIKRKLHSRWLDLLQNLDKRASLPDTYLWVPSLKSVIQDYKENRNRGESVSSFIKSLKKDSPDLIALIDSLRIRLLILQDAKKNYSNCCLDRAYLAFNEWAEGIDLEEELILIPKLLRVLRTHYPVTTPLDQQLIAATEVKGLAILLPIAKVLSSSLEKITSTISEESLQHLNYALNNVKAAVLDAKKSAVSEEVLQREIKDTLEVLSIAGDVDRFSKKLENKVVRSFDDILENNAEIVTLIKEHPQLPLVQETKKEVINLKAKIRDIVAKLETLHEYPSARESHRKLIPAQQRLNRMISAPEEEQELDSEED